MKHLKSYNLFEGFSEDFYTGIESIKSKYELELENFRQEMKQQVDQFMFELTDSYSNIKTFQNNFIEDDDPSIWYFLKCEWKDVDKFIELLEETSERIKEQLNLGFRLTAILSFYDNDNKIEHKVEHGHSIVINKLQDWIKLVKSHKDGGEKYDFLEISLNIV